MKILCFIDDLGSGGAQRQLVNLGIGFKSRGHHVTFLVYHKADFFKQNLIDAEIEVNQIFESQYLQRILKIRKFIRNGSYDVVLSFLEGPSFMATVSSLPYKKWKLIVGERNADPNILTSRKRKFYRWTHIFASHVVANSQANLDMVQVINPALSKSKCKVIYNAVNLIEKSTKNKLNNTKLNIVVGASHVYHKNSMGMLKAFNSLKNEEQKKIKISWYGNRTEEPYFDGSYPEAKEFIRHNNLAEYITFYPPTNELHEVMKKSDVVGLFSFYEGSPNVICEAMALAKPVMCSNVADMPVLLKDFPEQTFDPNDMQDIVKAFRFYLNLSQEQCNQISDSNFEVATRLFSPETNITEYLKLMEE